MAESIDYLIPFLRLKIGDMDSTSYRYIDAWLLSALIVSVRSLERYWNNKYSITDAGLVSRSTALTFATTEPPVVETDDEYIIILKAALITLSGSLENNSWNTGNWRDSEISYNNTEGAKYRNQNLQRLQAELDMYLLPPTKRLAKAVKRTLYGYKNNPYENKTEY